MKHYDQTNAYTKCGEIMLESPEYVGTDYNGVTYVLVKITDTDDKIAIHTQLINPVVPAEGNRKDFEKLPQDAQVAIVALPKISEVIGQSHEEVMKHRAHRELEARIPNEILNRLKQALEEDSE